jgi:hypothetical protein
MNNEFDEQKCLKQQKCRGSCLKLLKMPVNSPERQNGPVFMVQIMDTNFMSLDLVVSTARLVLVGLGLPSTKNKDVHIFNRQTYIRD